MTTIFTDDFCFSETEITLDEPSIGNTGQDLVFTTRGEKEIRIRLGDDQLNELADVLLLAGFEQTETN